ncbi:MAG: helix-turn-helix domain-containing protein [Patescibacteria group bacterium]
MLDSVSFSKVLKQARSHAGKSQAEIAEHLKVSRSSVSRWERKGDCKIEQANQWFTFCDVLITMTITSNVDKLLLPVQSICDECEEKLRCEGNNIVFGKNNVVAKTGLIIRMVGAVPSSCPYSVEHVVAGGGETNKN